MVLLSAAICVLLLGSAVAAATRSRPGASGGNAFAVGSAFAGSILALVSAVMTIATGTSWESWTVASTPIGPFSFGMDALSGVFVALISIVTGLAAIYGRAYLGGAEKADNSSPARMTWCWYNVLAASMIGVVTARDAMSFLLCWEAMSISSFFLVMFEHERPETGRAGWIYLTTTHVGTAFLFVMFMLLSDGGPLDFGSMASVSAAATSALRSAVFIAAVIGFGAKAGVVPLHIWLPEAHPAAPSHVSAVMSGVMLKTGVYGLFRIMSILGGSGQSAPASTVPSWWGWVLLCIGVASAIFGILFAVVGRDIKRLLAYSSIENVGIIFIGAGVGVLGVATGNTTMAACGLTGSIVHAINHGLMKSLLFMGAGSVVHSTGTRDIEQMGGLMKRMPWTGAAFLTGSAAIAALPPLNGFFGEFLIYMGAFAGIASTSSVWGGALAAVGMALTGGLAAVAFTRVVGVVFLGEPRKQSAARSHESPAGMLRPMTVLAVMCIAAGPAAIAMPDIVSGAATAVFPEIFPADLFPAAAGRTVAGFTVAVVSLGGLIALFAGLRAVLLSGRPARKSPTWDCGYAASSPRIQYTGSSFAEPVAQMFRTILHRSEATECPQGLFPVRASHESWSPDSIMTAVYQPIVRSVSKASALFHGLQQGRTHLYLLYIFATVLLLMVVVLGFGGEL